MAEPITIQKLIEASMDSDSLEVLVNGDENAQVTTRLGETYPSAKKAIKTMFENGGLPATPFKTKSLMQASSLTDGSYAIVTDDAEVDNGLYLKDGGIWTQSLYDVKRILLENAMFNPIQGDNINDFNNMDNQGVYYFLRAGTNWNEKLNKPPVQSQWAYMMVFHTASALKVQVCYCINSNKIFYRFFYSGAWIEWLELASIESTWDIVNSQVAPIKYEQLSYIKYEHLAPEYEPKTRNLFDKSEAIKDFRVETDGTTKAVEGAFCTPFIRVDQGSVTVSGLKPATGYRACVFYDKNKVKIIASSIAPDLDGKKFNLPVGTEFIRFTLVISGGTEADFDFVQAEYGPRTDYISYERGELIRIFGAEIKATNDNAQALSGITSSAIGAEYLLFGDSITATSYVDADVFDNPSGFTLWPHYAKDILKWSKFRNYAKSGASFKNRLGQHFQFLQNQVDKAIENLEVAEIIIVSCGTNDGISNLGDYDNAMSKQVSELDETKCLEAARKAFLTIRNQWPKAICFYCNPLQRASEPPETLSPMVEGLSKMAQRHGFILIDQQHDSGCLHEQETTGSAGVYLADGLHPHAEGRERQAKFICSQVIKNTTTSA